MEQDFSNACIDLMQRIYKGLNDSEQNELLEARRDFLSYAYQEFISGDEFARFPQERKRELLFQHSLLETLFDILADFFREHEKELEA